MTTDLTTDLHADVIEMARTGEPERYIAATLSPPALRPALIALAAFSADLRRIPLIVKEPMMGEVRLQWWRDAIAAFGTSASSGHPIADALAAAVQAHDLPTASLLAMTEARAFDLYDDPMPDDASLAGYLAKIEAVPFDLAMRICGGQDVALADIAARAFGQARLLAELPLALSKARLTIPLSALHRHGIGPDRLTETESAPAVAALIQEACRDVSTAHAALRQKLSTASRPTRLALLPVATVPSYLRAIQSRRRDPLRVPAEISPLRRVMTIGLGRLAVR